MTTPRQPLSRIAPLAIGLFLVSLSHAEITLVDSASFTNGDVTVGTRTITAADLDGFDANGADKLVVTIGGEGSGNGAADNTVLSVNYGGTPLSLAIAGASGNRRTSIWYLDNVTVTGDFVVNFQEDQDGIGFGAYALNGTLPDFADTSDSGGGTTLDIDTTTNGEFVVAALGRNNFDELLGAGTSGGGAPADTVGTQPPLAELFYANLNGSSAASAHAILPSPGTTTLAIYENNGSGRIVAAAFQAAAGGAEHVVLTITPTDGVAGSYDFSWNSADGKVYDLVSSSDLATDPATWSVYMGNGDLPSSAPTNTLTAVVGAGTIRFFAVVERAP